MNSPNVSKIILFSVYFFALVFATFSAVGKAEEKASDQKHDATTAKWKEYAAPRDHNKLLDSFVGRWNYTVKWWMSPDAKPAESKGPRKATLILGGRFPNQSDEGKPT